MKKIPVVSSYDTVEKAIGTSLAWYACYQAMVQTREQLELEYEQAEDSPLKLSIFLYCLEHNLTRLLKKHVFDGQEIVLSEDAFDEARDFLVCNQPYKDMLKLGQYLNYLDEWAQEYDNWKVHKPIPMESMVFVQKD